MTQERKDQLFDKMLGWISEAVNDSSDLFNLLHNQFQMTQEELHDCCIESLDEFFPSDARTRLKQKVQAKLRRVQSKVAANGAN